jgi:hypothetical protein
MSDAGTGSAAGIGEEAAATGATDEEAASASDDTGDEHRPSWWSRANPFRS